MDIKFKKREVYQKFAKWRGKIWLFLGVDMKNRIVLRELFAEQYQFVGSWVSDQPITLRPSSKEAKECRRQLAQLQAQKRNKKDVEKG